MTRKFRITLSFAVVSALLVAVWSLWPDSLRQAHAEGLNAEKAADVGMLDGKTFKGGVGPRGKPADVEDTFVFADGTFVSVECELRCQYPARPYFVRETGGAIEFISETECPYKDAKIVWRGTVVGDSIEGVATWTMSRWYWTIEKEFSFSGILQNASSPVASN